MVSPGLRCGTLATQCLSRKFLHSPAHLGHNTRFGCACRACAAPRKRAVSIGTNLSSSLSHMTQDTRGPPPVRRVPEVLGKSGAVSAKVRLSPGQVPGWRSGRVRRRRRPAGSSAHSRRTAGPRGRRLGSRGSGEVPALFIKPARTFPAQLWTP